MFRGIEREDRERKYTDSILAKRMWQQAVPFKKQLIIIIIAILIGTSANLLAPLMLELATNNLLGFTFWDSSLWKIFGSFDQIFGIALVASLYESMEQFFESLIGSKWVLVLAITGYIGSWITLWISEFVQRIANAGFIPDFMVNLRLGVFDAIQNQDLKFFDRMKTGRLNSRVSSDASAFGEVAMLITRTIANILILLAIFFILFLINPILALVTVIIAPLVLVVSFLFRRIARITSMSYRRSIAQVHSAMQENVSGIKVAKAFGQEGEVFEEFVEINQDNFISGFRRTLIMFALLPAMELISTLGTAFILYFGGYMSLTTAVIGIPTLYLFILYLGRFFSPLIEISTFYSTFQAGMAGFERILEVVDAEPEVKDQPNVIDIKKDSIRGDILFEAVDFAYIPDQPVLEKFNLHIHPGEKLAIVGHTGAGKTSLIAILSRFYAFQGGKIRLDGTDINQISLKSYRKLFGIVNQENFLFSGTIYENIRYGRQEATEDDVWKALETVNADEFIRYLPQGLNTQVGERGNLLSMGQRQLICFARAILTEPKVLILDEATRSVDAYTEALIQEALEVLLSGRTSIIIAHRLTTILNADRIIVLENGQIIEEGTHKSLLAKGGTYRKLYKQYFEHQSLDWKPN